MTRLYKAGRTRKPGSASSIWQYRELLRSLVMRNLKVKYQKSLLGFLWTLFAPLSIGLLLLVVFTYVVRIPINNYWAFLISGYFAWHFTQQCLNVGSYTLAEHANLIRSVPFPKEVLILSAILSRLVEYLVELTLVVIVLALIHHHGIPVSFVLIPVLILVHLLLVIGLALPIATLAVFYNDVQHSLPAVLIALFYISPVFYPVEMVPESFRALYMFNPIAQLLALYHAVLYKGSFVTLGQVGSITVIAVFAVGLGYAIFGHFKKLFAEII